MADIYEEEAVVHFHQVDSGGHLTPSAAALFFEGAALRDAERFDAGCSAMLSRNQAWVLSRILVQMDERPTLGNRVLVRTWPRGTEKLFAVRDYEIEKDGKVIIRARSAWLIIDITARRPLRPSVVTDKMPLNEGRDALPALPQSIAANENLAEVAQRTALYSDIDGNGHVNNARYIEWASDIIPQPHLAEAKSITYSINYTKELKEGASVNMLLSADEAPKRFNIEGREGETTSFRAEFELR